MKSNMQIVDVIPFTQDNMTDVEILKNSPEFEANSQAISRLRQNSNDRSIQLDEGVSFIPYDDGLELSLYTPKNTDNPHNIIGVYSQVVPTGEKFKRIPQELLIGRNAKFVIVLESDCSCCGEKHVLIIDADGERPASYKKYSRLENKNAGHDFEIAFPESDFDLTGELIQDVLSQLSQLKPQHEQKLGKILNMVPS